MECETLVISMHGKNQDGVCHVIKNKHGVECMQNFKQKEDLGSTIKPRCPKSLFVGAKTFMWVAKKRDAFLIHTLP
jgi:hypothetical protein